MAAATATAAMAMACSHRALAVASARSPATLSVGRACAQSSASLPNTLMGGLLQLPERTSRSATFVPRAAKSTGVEPDLFEGERDPWITAGEDRELLFPYGKADGAHTWHEGDDGTFWEGIVEVFESSGGPTGFQGTISWLFPFGIFAALYANLQSEFYVIYTSVFVWLFISFEFAKPDQPWHYEPDMYYDEELLSNARPPQLPLESEE